MDKLGMLDANFLYSETDKMMNHIASLQQFELPTGVSAGEFVTGLRAFLTDRIHLVPYLTRKIKFIPGGLDHAVWVSDGNFDIANHVIEVPIEAPGSFAQLEAKVAELHAKPMDRRKPLWAYYIFTGLDDGNIAFYNQVHHACLDGVAAQMAILSLTDNSPEHPLHHAPANYPEAEKPTLSELFEASFKNLMDYQMGAMDRNIGAMKSFTKMTQRAIDPGKSFGAMGQSAPRTRFNHAIEQERSYAAGKLSLTDVKKIGKTMGASVNDVFLSVCAGALRTYLERKSELPMRSLIAGCPVSVARPDGKQLGNSVTMMNVDLFTTIADPRVRLLKVKASAITAKEVTADLADGFDANVSLPGLPAMIRAASLASEISGAANALPMPMNVVISNVPGPRETLYSNGAKMLSHYPISIPAHGAGLNITVQSYCDALYVGFTACKKALPDADVLRDDLIAAFNELKALVLPDNVREISEALEAKETLQTAPVEVASVHAEAAESEQPLNKVA